MNDIQKSQIINMRAAGIGYKRIAKELDVSENTIKSFCRRNNLAKNNNITPVEIPKYTSNVKCKNCGKVVPQNYKRKKKQFCSDKCRMNWWNSHREQVKHKSVDIRICPGCHKEFKVYGKSDRKYCSHACYIKDRFGGANDE